MGIRRTAARARVRVRDYKNKQQDKQLRQAEIAYLNGKDGVKE